MGGNIARMEWEIKKNIIDKEYEMSIAEKTKESATKIIVNPFFWLFKFFAVILSYATNKSILWAIFHFICGWIYVVYYWFSYGHLTPLNDFFHAMFK